MNTFNSISVVLLCCQKCNWRILFKNQNLHVLLMLA